MKLDKVDKKILEILSKDSRVAYTEMAKTLGLSEGTIRRRVQSLIQSGMIKCFTIEVWEDNPKALVLVTTTPTVPTPQVAEKILKLDGVETAWEVAGQYDISVVVSMEDIAGINQCIDNIRGIEGVQNTNTLFVLRKWG